MTNVISIITRQPIIQDNEIGSSYFRTTSSSKPKHTYNPSNVPAYIKRTVLLNNGWSEYVSHDHVSYTNPKIDNNSPYFLDDAFSAHLENEYYGWNYGGGV